MALHRASVPPGLPAWTVSRHVDHPVLDLAIGAVLVSQTPDQSAATFIFNQNEPFSIESGGPSNEYGGSGLSFVQYGVSGAEGNGTIQFLGTFTSISWTNPQFENWYGFTVGDPTPLPTAWLMLLSALAGLGFISYRDEEGPRISSGLNIRLLRFRKDRRDRRARIGQP